MSDCFILLAAGKGKRFKSNTFKQFHILNGKPLINHSIEKAIKSKIFKEIIVVTNSKIKKPIDKSIKVIKGGSERFESSKKALEYIKNKKFKNVYIHDAARPNFSIKLLERLKRELNNNKKYISDEATLFIKSNLKIKFIKGEEDNFKITTTKDLDKVKLKTFYGIGFDIHRLVKGKKLYLGGIHIPYHSGLKGHSDGDVIIHSIIDALLGCMKKNDIGSLYPNNELKYKNIRSTKMLKPVLETLKKENYNLNNIDINLICEKPSVTKNRMKIIRSLSKLLKIKNDKINIKGKTVEKLGIIGKEKAIACEVIVSVSNYD